MERLIVMIRTNREVFVTKIKTRIQYFNDHSSLPSIGHVISLSPTSMFKRLFWLVTFSACCYGSAVVLRGALGLYTQDAVSYSVETDYLQWDTPFPAVTICEYYNETKIKIGMPKHKYPTSVINFAKEIAFWNKKICKTCINCKMNVSCIEDYLPILDIARSKCEELMTSCWFNGEEISCCDIFKPLATEYGVCFVFNSQLTGDGHVNINSKVALPTLLFTVVGKVTIRVHSPEETTSVASENILGACYHLHLGSILEVNLVAEEIVNDVSVHTIAAGSRDCLFKDERPPSSESWPFEEYSYSSCVWYCRTMAQVRMCNCTYHFMPRIENIPMCNIEGLKCLYKNKDSLEIGNCHCPMSCAEVTYKVVSISCPKTNNDTRATQGSVRIGQLPHLRVRRHAIRDMLGLVVDIGGVVGVFFGASLLSFIEIVYIFCIRKYT